MPADGRLKFLTKVFCALLGGGLALGLEVINFSASPGTLSFSSANPSATSTTQATVLYRIKGGKKDKPWNLTVYASGSSFSNCSFLPTSSVRVTCASASVTGGGYLGTVACNSAFDLSTSAGTVASGLQGDGDQDYTILINYTLTDAWMYPGKISPSCSLTLNYTVTANE